MNTCTIDNCTKPIHIKKRSLCRAHYMAWWKAGGEEHTTAAQSSCAQCGAAFDLTHGSRKHCSPTCRERAKYLRACADRDRYARLLQRARDAYTPKRPNIFHSNTCDDCGTPFIERTHTPSRYCSTRCAHRSGKRTRRAREHNAPGTFTYAQLMKQYLRQGKACAYCKEATPNPQPEHVLPLSRGGRNDMTNIVAACPRCNGDKTDRTLDEWATSRATRGMAPVDTRLDGSAYRNLWHQAPTSPRWCEPALAA